MLSSNHAKKKPNLSFSLFSTSGCSARRYVRTPYSQSAIRLEISTVCAVCIVYFYSVRYVFVLVCTKKRIHALLVLDLQAAARPGSWRTPSLSLET